MSKYPLLVAGVLATFAKNVVREVLAGPEQNEKKRPVSDILDVRNSFVPGYPKHIEGERA
jgi:hypothetical protein